MTHKTKIDFSISGHLAFKSEENSNYVVVEKLHENIKSSNNVPKTSQSDLNRVRNKQEVFETNIEFKKLKEVTKDLNIKASNIRPAISPITNEHVPRDHDYFSSPNKLVKLRSIKNNPPRVNLEDLTLPVK